MKLFLIILLIVLYPLVLAPIYLISCPIIYEYRLFMNKVRPIIKKYREQLKQL
jgi:hypothetical protein